MNVKKLGVAAVLTAGLGISGAAQANLIQNGDFEACVSTAPTGWSGSSATYVTCQAASTMIFSSPPTILPYAGSFMAEIKSDVSDQNLYQSFYGAGVVHVKFAYNLLARDFVSGGDEGPDWFRVLVDGVQYFSASLDAPVGQWVQTGWLNVGFSTAALASGQHTLQFCLDTSNANTGFVCQGGNAGVINPFLAAFVDNVFVPEPGTLALLGLGLLGLGLTRRKAA